MFIGIGNPIPTIANLPGSSRPGGGSGGGGGGIDQIANNYSMEFDGVDDNIIVAIPGSFFTKSDPWSISTWVTADTRTTALGLIGNTTSANGIRIQTSNPGSPNIEFTFYMVGGGTWVNNYLAVSSGAVAWLSTTWYHLVVTYDGSVTGAGLNMYVNNNPTTSASADFTAGDSVSTANLAIGARKPTPAFSLGWNGKIDEVALFDYKLEASDVQAIYDATDTNLTADLSSMATPPVVWYRMGD